MSEETTGQIQKIEGEGECGQTIGDLTASIQRLEQNPYDISCKAKDKQLFPKISVFGYDHQDHRKRIQGAQVGSLRSFRVLLTNLQWELGSKSPCKTTLFLISNAIS